MRLPDLWTVTRPWRLATDKMGELSRYLIKSLKLETIPTTCFLNTPVLNAKTQALNLSCMNKENGSLQRLIVLEAVHFRPVSQNFCSKAPPLTLCFPGPNPNLSKRPLIFIPLDFSLSNSYFVKLVKTRHDKPLGGFFRKKTLLIMFNP